MKKSDFKTIKQYIGLFVNYRKPLTLLALERIKQELSAQTKAAKEHLQKYDELFRMTETYIVRLHVAEKENKVLREAATQYIADVAEYGDSFCVAAGHNTETCSECRLRGLIK